MNIKVPLAVLLACLLCPLAATAVDTDSDGIVDSQDNCVTMANLDQHDTDFDGFGNVCDADFNNDCVVNFMDMLMFRAVFFSNHQGACDLTGDGFVNFADLQLIRLPFFGAPGPSGIQNICN